MLFMSFPTVPADQAWTCHPEDYHFTQHLTETQRDKKGRKKGRGKKVRAKERDEKREHNRKTWLKMRQMCFLERNYNLWMTMSNFYGSVAYLLTDDWGSLLSFPVCYGSSCSCPHLYLACIKSVCVSYCMYCMQKRMFLNSCWLLPRGRSRVISVCLNHALMCVKCTEYVWMFRFFPNPMIPDDKE